MNISAWSIRQPLPALLLFAGLLMAGWWGWRGMAVQTMPDVEVPALTVSVAWPGAAPVQIETELVRRLEGAIAGVSGLRDISTTIVEGAAVIGVEFHLERGLPRALEDVRAAVLAVRSELPAGVRDPVVAGVNLTGLPMLTLAVSAPGLDLLALSRLVDDRLAPPLRATPGVGRVGRVGGLERELRVEPDALRLMALNLTLADLARPLRQTLLATPGGKTRAGDTDILMRSQQAFNTAQDLTQLSLPMTAGPPLLLGQVATVSDTRAEPRSWALLDGQPVVAIEISRARGAGEPQVGAAVSKVLEALRAQHPGLELREVFSLVEPARETFQASMHMLLEGALLTVLVVWVFLRNARATLIAAVALPMAVVPTFAVMHLMGFSLNALTLLSLSLVVGVLVDDAIVEIENILRHLHMGKTPLQATLDATQEIGPAVVATTLALVAVFVPMAFMDGVVGRYFRQFGWTAAAAVAFSLLVARMLTPMMAAWLLRPVLAPLATGAGGVWSKTNTALLRLTGMALRFPGCTLTAAASLLVLSVAVAMQLPTGFLPAENVAHTQVNLTAAPGTTAAQTLAMAERARQAMAALPEVVQVYTTIGAGQAGGDAFDGPGLHEQRRATLTVKLVPRQAWSGQKRVDIEARLRLAMGRLPGTQVRMGAGAGSERWSFTLSGQDSFLLEQHAHQLGRELSSIAGVGTVQCGVAEQRLELVAEPRPVLAAERGVTSTAIGEALRYATAGDLDAEPPRVTLGGQSVPVVLRLAQAARDDAMLLDNLMVNGARGPVPLGQVAELRLQAAPARIERRQQQRSLAFEVELNGLSLGQVQQAALLLPGLAQLPAGVVFKSQGDAETMTELFDGFAFAMGAGVLCVFAVLVLQLRNLAQPLTVLAALALALPGAVLALALTGRELAMPALIGLLLLMGVAAKNAILLVDHVVAARRRGVPREQALYDACAQRSRPIVMTTLAMAAGMLPTALGLGSDPAFRVPLAVVVICGLVGSTVMSLVVVPVVYRVVDDGSLALRNALRRG